MNDVVLSARGLTKTFGLPAGRQAHTAVDHISFDVKEGEIVGINASLQALGQAIPPILSGFVAAEFNPEMPILVSAIIIFLSWLFFCTLFERRKRRLGVT